MTEAPYLFFVTLAFLAVQDVLSVPSSPSRSSQYRTLFLLGFCIWIHPQAATVLLTAAILLIERRRERALPILLGAALIAALPFLYNALSTGILSSYWVESRQSSLFSVLVSNLTRWPLLLSEAMFQWIEPIPGAGSWASWVLALAAFALIGLEFLRRETSLDRIGQVYLLTFVGLHLFWANQLHRYAFPLLPFLFLFLLRPFFRAGAVGRRFSLFLAGLFVFIDLTLIGRAHQPRPGENLPPAAYEWIRDSSSPEDVFAAGRPEPLYLYSGRRAVRLAWVEDPDAWFGALVDKGVAFAVADHPERDLPPAAASRRDPLLRRLSGNSRRLNDPTRFEVVYQDDTDTQVVRLSGVEAFKAGRALLEQARGAIGAGDFPKALALMAKADAQKAPLVRLPFYRGTTLLLAGKPRDARPFLEEAVRREPDFAAARANLARLP